MNCVNAKEQLDDYLDGSLSDVQRAALECHLQGCATCRRAWDETRRLAEALREVPVRSPSSGFSAHALRRARMAPHNGLSGWGFAAGFGSAAAAGLALWLIASLWLGAPTQRPSAQRAQNVGGVELALDKVHAVNLAFNAPTDIRNVTFTLQLPSGVQLQGHPGQERIVWRDGLRKGRNVLHLRLIARGGVGGDLIARVQHHDHSKAFRVHLRVNTPQALGIPVTAQLG